MLQYPDLTLDDIQYYWGNSVVMLETDGAFTACVIASIRSSNKYPIMLTSVLTGEKVISLRRQAFVRRVLVHHPALGYGDYKGIPLYLSPSAGQGLRKGVDRANLTALCPIDWKESVSKNLKAITTKARRLIREGRSTLPVDVSRAYRDLTAMYSSMNHLSSRGSMIAGVIHITNRAITARLLEQSVNNTYPSVTKALLIITEDKALHGISVSRDFALLRTTGNSPDTCTVYHRMTPVGTISIQGGGFSPSVKLSTTARKCVADIFNQLSREK